MYWVYHRLTKDCVFVCVLTSESQIYDLQEKHLSDVRYFITIIHWPCFLGDMNSCPTKSSVIAELCDLHGLHDLTDHPTCFKCATPSAIAVILITNRKKYCGVINCILYLYIVLLCYVFVFSTFTCAYSKRVLNIHAMRSLIHGG